MVELDEALRRTEERTKVLEEEVGEARGEAEAKAVVIQSLEQAEDEWKAKVSRQVDKNLGYAALFCSVSFLLFPLSFCPR